MERPGVDGGGSVDPGRREALGLPDCEGGSSRRDGDGLRRDLVYSQGEGEAHDTA